MTIWVDGEVVFSKSSWKFICEHDIQVGSETLATRFGWAKRGFIFEVFDGDTLVATADYPRPDTLGWKKYIRLVGHGIDDTALVFFFFGFLSQSASAVEVGVARENRYSHSKLPGCASSPPCRKLSEGATTKSEDKVVRPNNMR